jgi:GH24 family phage-related lysozyme (muramidase)
VDVLATVEQIGGTATWESDSGNSRIKTLTIKGAGQVGFSESTKEMVIKHEGFVDEAWINWDSGSNKYIFTIGYGLDFYETDTELFEKYITTDKQGKYIPKAKMSKEDAEKLIYEASVRKGIYGGLEDFISGKGKGNTQRKLDLTQNQYDVLFSYFYNNGPHVFEDWKYDEWINSSNRERNIRAEARIELRDYLINKNGAYDSQMITDLFINSKGPNMKYDYQLRREDEARVFNK